MNNSKHIFVRAAGICSILAPLMMLAADSFLLVTGRSFEWSIALWLSFVLFVPAIFGMTYLSAGRASRWAVAGGASAFFGCMAGASMQVLFRVHAVLHEAGSTQAVELLKGSRKLVTSTQMIGIFFPVGLLILAVCLYQRRVVSPLVPLSLAAGAVLFPVGRIAGFAAAVIGSGLLLALAFGMAGVRLLSARAGGREGVAISETAGAL